jgi:hypothetical protein
LASSDEAAWQFFGDGLLQSDEDEFMPGHPSGQTRSANKEAASALVPVSLTVLGRAIARTKIQVEAHGFHRAARLEEGGDMDPDYEVRYDGDTSDDAVSDASGLDLNLPAAIIAPDLNLPAAIIAPGLNLPAATSAPDLNFPEAINAPELNLVPSAILARELSLTPTTGALVLATRATSNFIRIQREGGSLRAPDDRAEPHVRAQGHSVKPIQSLKGRGHPAPGEDERH